MANELIGASVQTYTLDAVNHLADLEEGYVEIRNEFADGRGVSDTDPEPIYVKKTWEAGGTVMIALAADLMLVANSATPEVTISADVGPITYSGTGLLKSARHSTARFDVQRQAFSITGQGALTIT